MKKLLFVILVFTTLSSIQAINTNLTNEEREWLAKHQIISIAPDPDFPPIEWFDENGIYQGISSEFMDLISRDLGIHFEVVHCNNWDEVLQKARDRKVDMLPAAAQTPQRAEYMDFSSPHLIFPGVIITRNNFPEIKTTEQLQGKKIVVVSGYVWQDFLSIYQPDIEIIPVKTLLDGLRDISTGVQDVMIATLPVAIYYIEQEGILNLRVSGETGYFTKLSILTRKDWPILGTIIQKSLSNIPADKKKEINRKWITLDRKSIFSNKQFWIILILILVFSLVGFIIILLFNRILKQQVKKQTIELSISEQKYRTLTETSSDVVFALDTKGIFTYISSAFEKVTGYQSKQFLGCSFTKMLAPEYIETTIDNFNRGIEGEKIPLYEVEFLHKNGIRIPAELNVSSLFDNEGKVVGRLAVARDITERKKVEKEILEKSIQLEKQFKISEKQRIATTVLLQDLNKTTENLKTEIIGHNKSEEKLKARMIELEIFNDATVDRELKINELRKEINKLLKKMDKKEKYKIIT